MDPRGREQGEQPRERVGSARCSLAAIDTSVPGARRAAEEHHQNGGDEELHDERSRIARNVRERAVPVRDDLRRYARQLAPEAIDEPALPQRRAAGHEEIPPLVRRRLLHALERPGDRRSAVEQAVADLEHLDAPGLQRRRGLVERGERAVDAPHDRLAGRARLRAGAGREPHHPGADDLVERVGDPLRLGAERLLPGGERRVGGRELALQIVELDERRRASDGGARVLQQPLEVGHERAEIALDARDRRAHGRIRHHAFERPQQAVRADGDFLGPNPDDVRGVGWRGFTRRVRRRRVDGRGAGRHAHRWWGVRQRRSCGNARPEHEQDEGEPYPCRAPRVCPPAALGSERHLAISWPASRPRSRPPRCRRPRSDRRPGPARAASARGR